MAIPLTLAGWCRYLLGIDDRGEPFAPSPDPLLEQLQSRLARLRLCDTEDVHPVLSPILSDPAIFGADLYAVGLGERVEDYFIRMLAGKGAVRKTLEEVLA